MIDLLRRAWAAFDESAKHAASKELAPAGPRGGGRSVAKMRSHVHEADGGYLNALWWPRQQQRQQPAGA